MPTAVPAWFNEEQYLINKTAQTNIIEQDGRDNWTVAEITEAITAAGMTPYEHFVRYGNSENVSPNDYFNVSEYIVAKTAQLNANESGDHTWTNAETLQALTDAGLSAWDHYTLYGAEEGINPSNEFDTQAYLQAKADQLNRINWEDKDDWDIASTEAALKAAGLNPIEHYYLYGREEGLSIDPVPATSQVTVPSGFNPWVPDEGGDQPVTYEEIFLTSELDVVNGTSANEIIYGYEFDGTNTLQTGDRIDGGAGHDILVADVVAGSTFGEIINTVRPTVSNVERIKFTSQQSTDTYHGVEKIAGIRADRISSTAPTTELWDSESRASLTVDDVRIDSNKMLIGWQNADNARDAGQNLNYTVHFNNQYLKADDQTSSGELTLQLLDTQGALQDQPLLNNFYEGARFYYNGNLISLYWGEINGANATYQTLLEAVQKAIADTPEAAGLTASLGAQFDANAGWGGTPVYGTQIIISTDDGTISDENATWILSGNPPHTNSMAATMFSGVDTDCPLLQTDIALDNVGMVNWTDPSTCFPDNQQFGDYAGDMEVGGMGNGKWVGLQRFDVTVDRGSWLSSLLSTNNALRMINVKNGDLDDADAVTGTSTNDLGNLFIGDGQRITDNAIEGGSLMFDTSGLQSSESAARVLSTTARYGMLADAGYAYRDASGRIVEDPHGILDVKTFDASQMYGDANIAAAITSLSSEKYLKDSDQYDAEGVRIAPNGDFKYHFGEGDDTLNMKIDGFVAADKDFVMDINMGDGNNNVHTSMYAFSGAKNWVQDQKFLNNIKITTGSGDDIINPWGTGRYTVNAGAGNDIVYSDNSGIVSDSTDKLGSATDPVINGVGAVWILNATTSDDASLKVEVADGNIVPVRNDILSTTNYTYSNTNLSLTTGRAVTVTAEVTYKGITGTYSITENITPNSNGTTGTYSITQAKVNQLIADAVNNDPDSWLSSLLSAQEGAGNSLMFISKVDGKAANAATDALTINVTATYGTLNPPTSAELTNATAGDLTTYGNSYGNLSYAMDGGLDGTGTDKVQGANSTAAADNTINLGAGDDLAVLSTGQYSNETIVLNNSDNGHDTIVNFQTSGNGQDYVNVASILGHQVQVTDIHTEGTYSNPDSPISGVNGTSTAYATSIVYVANAANAQTQGYIGSANALQAQLGAASGNPHYHNALFMVYNADTAGEATFDMYRASYDGSGNVSVTDLGDITFANFTDGTEYYNTISDYLAKAATAVGVSGVSEAQLTDGANAWVEGQPYDNLVEGY